MDNPHQQLIEKLKSANNVLVTVSRDPSVDQLAACIGLTLLINKLGKHGTAVFSGEIPSTLEFLQPTDTLEKNTDSLRDFIIALDKSKADKLRYKVEDDVVRIFITPYKTSITADDLEFSQGDFNVDLVVALGVQRQEDFDEAILSHGRILHDATLSSINLNTEASLGSINWNEPEASSLCELITDLAGSLGQNLLDAQVSTALLTGIVAETKRFSNEKTSARTMTLSSLLMTAGANQQLVASKLETPATSTSGQTSTPDSTAATDLTDSINAAKPKSEDGTLEIEHAKAEEPESAAEVETSAAPIETPEPEQPAEPETPVPGEEPAVDKPLPDEPSSPAIELPEPAEAIAPPHSETPELGMADLPVNEGYVSNSPRLVIEPLGPAADTAVPSVEVTPPVESASPSVAPEIASLMSDAPPPVVPEAVSVPAAPEPVAPITPAPAASHSEPFIAGLTPPPPAWVPPADDPFNMGTSTKDETAQTLADLETAVHSPHVGGDGLNEARDEVMRALSGTPAAPAPIQALNAQPLGDTLHTPDATPASDALPGSDFNNVLQQQIPAVPPTPPGIAVAEVDQTAPVTAPQVTDSTAPPPVPPPIPFNFGGTTPAV